jgi:hypothetical protein
MTAKMTVKSVIYEKLKHILDENSSEEGDWIVKHNEGPVSKWRKFRVLKADFLMEYYRDSHFFTVKGVEDGTTDKYVAIRIPLNSPQNSEEGLMENTRKQFRYAQKLDICHIPTMIVGTDSYIVTSWCGVPVHDARKRYDESWLNYLEGLDALSKIVSVYEHFGNTPLKVLNVLWHKPTRTVSVDVGFGEEMNSVSGSNFAGVLYAFIYGKQLRRVTDVFEYLVDAPIGRFMDDLMRKGMSPKKIKSRVDWLTGIYGTSAEQVREVATERIEKSELHPIPNSSFFVLNNSMLLTQVRDSQGVAKTISTLCSNMDSFIVPGHFYMTLRSYLDRFCYHEKILEIISNLREGFGRDGVPTLDLDGYIINQEYPDDDREPVKIRAVFGKRPRNSSFDCERLVLAVLARFNTNELFVETSALSLIPNKAI